MVAKPHRQRLILPVALLGGAALGLVTAAGFALVPGDMLARVILRSGIPAIIAAAEPPLGITARIVLALAGGGIVALLSWFALFLVLGSRTLVMGSGAAVQADGDTDDSVPVLRRADAHPDAPSRRPVFANRDLGTPFLDVRARPAHEAGLALPPEPAPLPMAHAPMDLPVDLGMTLSAFDPGAIGLPIPPMAAAVAPSPPQPLVAPSLVSPAERPQVFEPTERFETFELTPMVRSDPAQPAAAPQPSAAYSPAVSAEPDRQPRDTQATITALLERLERGVTQLDSRAPSPAAKRDARTDDRLQETLGTLRRMATRG